MSLSERQQPVNWKILLALCGALIVVDIADARPRRRFRRRATNYSYAQAYNTYSNSYGSYGSPQSAASSKAQILANAGGGVWHPGGGFGGGYAEGVGSGATAAAALGNCCFRGYRAIAAESVVQSHNGLWYACTIYW